MKYRSFPVGEGVGGWGLLNRIVLVQECDATEDDKKYYCRYQKIKTPIFAKIQLNLKSAIHLR